MRSKDQEYPHERCDNLFRQAIVYEKRNSFKMAVEMYDNIRSLAFVVSASYSRAGKALERLARRMNTSGASQVPDVGYSPIMHIGDPVSDETSYLFGDENSQQMTGSE